MHDEYCIRFHEWISRVIFSRWPFLYSKFFYFRYWIKDFSLILFHVGFCHWHRTGWSENDGDVRVLIKREWFILYFFYLFGLHLMQDNYGIAVCRWDSGCCRQHPRGSDRNERGACVILTDHRTDTPHISHFTASHPNIPAQVNNEYPTFICLI